MRTIRELFANRELFAEHCCDDLVDAVADRDDVGDAVPLQTKDIRGSVHIPYEKARLHLEVKKIAGLLSMSDLRLRN